MKKLTNFIASGLLMCTVVANAGNPSPIDNPAAPPDSCNAGVFLTEEDFVHGILSYKTNLNEKGNKISIAFPADLSFKVEIQRPTQLISLHLAVFMATPIAGKCTDIFAAAKNYMRSVISIKSKRSGLASSCILLSLLAGMKHFIAPASRRRSIA